MPGPKWGERIVAAVELRAGAGASVRVAELPAERIAFVGERLADHKKPRQVLVLDALPRNALGKVVEPQLSERFSARGGRAQGSAAARRRHR